MNWRILIAAGAVLFSGALIAQENVALGKPVHLVGEGFFDGNPEPPVEAGSITDGEFLPPFSDWNNGTVWWLNWSCGHGGGEPCWIEIDLQGTFEIHSMIFQGDSDLYLVEFWNKQFGHWEPAWLVPNTWGYVQTRPNWADDTERHVLDVPVITNRLRVLVIEGDGWNAVSEVQASAPTSRGLPGGGLVRK